VRTTPRTAARCRPLFFFFFTSDTSCPPRNPAPAAGGFEARRAAAACEAPLSLRRSGARGRTKRLKGWRRRRRSGFGKAVDRDRRDAERYFYIFFNHFAKLYNCSNFFGFDNQSPWEQVQQLRAPTVVEVSRRGPWRLGSIRRALRQQVQPS
jgi:hypothetical protein